LAANLGLMAFLEIAQFLERRGYVHQVALTWPIALRWAACYALLLGIVFLGEFGSSRFIYFQF
jgi:hypothetical protein